MAFARLDFPCLLTTILFFTSDLLRIIIEVGRHQRSGDFNYQAWTDLEPAYIQVEWARRAEHRGLVASAGLLSALAWFSLCIPILNLAWILSAGGRRKVGLHVLVAALAMGGSIAELLARLMMAGVDSVGHWLASSWNLDNWLGEDSGDGMGWRVLEVAYMLSRGIVLWVDAFEWLALFGIFTMLFVSMRSDEDRPFGIKLARLGLVIGVLSLIDFLAEVLRFKSWRTFMTIALAISTLNTLILLPAWLLWLGTMLPRVRSNYEQKNDTDQKEPFVTVRGGHFKVVRSDHGGSNSGSINGGSVASGDDKDHEEPPFVSDAQIT